MVLMCATSALTALKINLLYTCCLSWARKTKFLSVLCHFHSVISIKRREREKTALIIIFIKYEHFVFYFPHSLGILCTVYLTNTNDWFFAWLFVCVFLRRGDTYSIHTFQTWEYSFYYSQLIWFGLVWFGRLNAKNDHKTLSYTDSYREIHTKSPFPLKRNIILYASLHIKSNTRWICFLLLSYSTHTDPHTLYTHSYT